MILLAHVRCVLGQEAAFCTYEDTALQIWREHGGKVLETFQSDANLSTASVPHEIQRLRTESSEAFNASHANKRL